MLKQSSLWLLIVILGLLTSMISPCSSYSSHRSYHSHSNWHNHHHLNSKYYPFRHHHHFPHRFCCLFLPIVFGIICAVILYQIYSYAKARVRLSQGSLVAISGSCTSRVGKELILTFAKNHSCDIVIYNNEPSSVQGLLEEIKSQKPKVTLFERLLKQMSQRAKTEDAPENQCIADSAQEQERKCGFYQVDFQNKDTIRMALAQTMADFGRIDILIHIAEESEEKDFETYTPEEISAVTQTHFLGPAYMIKEVLAIMQEQSKGQIAYIPMQIGDFVDSSIFAYEGGKSDLSLVCERLRTGLRKRKSVVKVTVANSDLIVGQDKREVSMKEIRNGVKKMYQGILNQKEEIRKTEIR